MYQRSVGGSDAQLGEHYRRPLSRVLGGLGSREIPCGSVFGFMVMPTLAFVSSVYNDDTLPGRRNLSTRGKKSVSVAKSNAHESAAFPKFPLLRELYPNVLFQTSRSVLHHLNTVLDISLM